MYAIRKILIFPFLKIYKGFLRKDIAFKWILVSVRFKVCLVCCFFKTKNMKQCQFLLKKLKSTKCSQGYMMLFQDTETLWLCSNGLIWMCSNTDHMSEEHKYTKTNSFCFHPHNQNKKTKTFVVI